MALRSKRMTTVWLLLTALVVAVMATWATNRWVDRGRPARKDLPDDVCYDLVYLNELAGLPPSPEACEDMRPSFYPSPRAQAFYRRLVERAKPYYENETTPPSALWVYRPPTDTCNRGWPFISHRQISRVGIAFRSADNEPRYETLFYADVDGTSPTQYIGLAANFVVYFAVAASLPLCCKLMMVFSWRLVVKLSTWYQRRERPIRRRWVISAMILMATPATWWTHTHVSTWEMLDYGGRFRNFYLNKMMGLPYGSIPAEYDPLGGAHEAGSEQIAFCERLAERLESAVPPQHTPQIRVHVRLDSRRVRGWPFATFDPVATIRIDDYPDAVKGRQTVSEFAAAEDGGPALRVNGLIGNWLVFFAASFPLLWLLNMVLSRLTQRVVQTQPSFPVVDPSTAPEVPFQ